MAIYCSGKIIKEARKRRGISQEELCDGICEPPTLSKIENGRQNPSRRVFEALLQRLGLPIGIFNIPVTEEEFERSLLERKIVNRIGLKLYDGLDELLEKFKNCGEMTELDRQFYLFELTILKSHKEKYAELKNDMLKVIKMTIPNYDENFDISKHYLTILELMCINNIAIEESLLGNKEKAISIMMSLKEYFETEKVDIHEKIKEYPVILSNLSDWLGETERYQECLEVSEEGITFCVEQGKLVCLSDFLYNKGYCLVKLGKDKEQAKKFILYSIVLGKIGNDSELLELSKIFSKENFGEDLTESI